MTSQEQQVVNAPPRICEVPGLPQPQTNLGCLEHTGLNVDELELITDIPPSLDWMVGMNLFLESFEYKTDSPMTKALLSRAVMSRGNQSLGHLPPAWIKIPFTGSKWWNAMPCFKFIAIKPPRVTGKLLVRFSFRTPESVRTPGNDLLQRGILKEWDLGATSQFEFDLSGVTNIRARPTWIPRAASNDQHYMVKPMELHPSIWWFGMIDVFPALRLQPGGIFPDSIRILVFRYFKNATFYTATDFSGVGNHVLTQHQTESSCVNSPWYVNYDDTGTNSY
ncbi:MAG: hypothetical protein GABPV1_gp3 [Guiyang argiope bruennichi polycipivirus 1]|nr:MAG: hypothetical protein GABPV1_gp3 [Guiyang argiope bruennichi polycipivirus 1]